MIRQRVSVTGAIPTVAGDFVRFAYSTSGEHDCFRAKNLKLSALAVVPECSNHSRSIFEQSDDANFHVHIDSAMDPMVLQCPDHFEAGAIAHMRQPRVFVPAKVSLKNASIFG